MKVTIYEAKRHFLSKRKQWRWKITASNGKIVGASTEAYFNKSECIDDMCLIWKALNDYDVNGNNVKQKLTEALEKIATGEISGDSKNYKLSLEIIRNIASEAVELAYTSEK